MILAALLLAGSYGEQLLGATLARHRELRSIAVTVAGLPALTVGVPARSIAIAPLTNAMGEPIGTVTVTACSPAVRAKPIAADLARRIYVAGNLREPNPFVAGAAPSHFAQQLIDQALVEFPDLVTLAFRVAPHGRSNVIIASSFGRIGKLGDADDARIIATGIASREVTNGGRRLAVEAPLLDRAGRIVGAVSMSFRIGREGEAADAYRRAVQIRDSLARRIPSLGILSAGSH